MQLLGRAVLTNQNQPNFGRSQKGFQTGQGTHLARWGLRIEGLKVFCRLTCLRDSCSRHLAEARPPGHHCSEVEKGPPPNPKWPPEGATTSHRGHKGHQRPSPLHQHQTSPPFPPTKTTSTTAITTMTTRGQCWYIAVKVVYCCTLSLCYLTEIQI